MWRSMTAIGSGLGALVFAATAVAVTVSGGPIWLGIAMIVLWLIAMAGLVIHVDPLVTAEAFRARVAGVATLAMIRALLIAMIGESLIIGLCAVVFRTSPSLLFYAFTLGMVGLIAHGFTSEPSR